MCPAVKSPIKQTIDHAALADDHLLDLAVKRIETGTHLLSLAVDLGEVGGHAGVLSRQRLWLSLPVLRTAVILAMPNLFSKNRGLLDESL